MEDISNSRIVAVGDVHGELGALREILAHAGILGDRDEWIGGPTIFVQTGDVIDRGPDSVGVYELLGRLQAAAPAQGGAVVRLLGNHELALLQRIPHFSDVPDWHAFRLAIERDVLAGKVRGAYANGDAAWTPTWGLWVAP